MALWITVGWGVVSVVYLVLNSRKHEKQIIPSTASYRGEVAGTK
jgi:heme exporter protein D